MPIIADAITKPMPQESGAATLISTRGAGVLLKRASDIVPVVRRMVDDALYYAAMRKAAASVAVPGATRRIVEEIAALIPAAVMANEEQRVAEIRPA